MGESEDKIKEKTEEKYNFGHVGLTCIALSFGGIAPRGIGPMNGFMV